MDTPETQTEPVAETSMEAAFMEAAAKLEIGEQVESLIPDESPPEASVETEENVPTEAELADPANKDRLRDPISGKFIKRKTDVSAQTAEQKAGDAPKTAPDAAQASDYEKKKQEKAAKEEERKNRSWENLNREKDELARRRQEWEQREQQMRQPQQQRQAQQPREFSSQQLFEAKNDFRKTAREAFKRYQENGNEADLDLFNQNDQWADQAEQNAIQFFEMEERENQQGQQEQFKQAWNGHMDAVIKANPELLKKGSPIEIQMSDLLQKHGALFSMIPDGFRHAEAIAKLRLDAADTPTLRTQLATAKAEIDRLNGKLAPTPGGVTTVQSQKKFEDMTSAEQEKYLERAAARADGQ